MHEIYMVTGLPPRQYRDAAYLGNVEPYYWAHSEEQAKAEVKACKACGWTKVSWTLFVSALQRQSKESGK